jgi:hypothetical protein
MPYLGRAPTGTGSVTEIDGDLKITGQLTANDTLFKMIMDTAANLGDNILIEDGGTDGSGTNAGDDICLEKDMQVVSSPEIDGDIGKVLQVVHETSHEYITSTVLAPFDDTILQIDEGVEVITKAITPASASNLLKIDFHSTIGGTQNYKTFGIFQDSTANALASSYLLGNYSNDISLSTVIVAGTTSATTIRCRVGNSSGTVSVNGYSTGSNPRGGDIPHTVLIITEISA